MTSVNREQIKIRAVDDEPKILEVLEAFLESKGFRVITLRSPLYVRGTFKSPQAGVKAGPLIVRGAVAAALATLVTPAAALLALISPAEGDSNQCRTILSQMKK